MGTVSERLEIRGMSCANCSGTVEDALTGIEGVVEADVNFATDEGSVTYDPEKTDLGTLYDAIADAGYDPVRERVTVGITDCRVRTVPRRSTTACSTRRVSSRPT